MIKLGSENFPVTNLVSYCVSRKLNITIAFEHADVLEIQDISCKKIDKFLPF